MRLIDADDLLEQRVYTVAKGKGFPYREAYKNMLDDIEHAPIIDAEPIRHAYWKTNVYASQVVVCSFCNNTSLVPTTYCGNCGAKMDEEVEE